MVDVNKPAWKTCPDCGGDKHFNAERCRECRKKAFPPLRYRMTTDENGKTIYEHRVIAERMIGRKLERWEHVHHINGDKLDNRPENLEVLSRSEHAKRHGCRTVCDHELTPENTYVRPDTGKKVCRACQQRRTRYRAWRRKVERHARGLIKGGTPLEPFRG